MPINYKCFQQYVTPYIDISEDERDNFLDTNVNLWHPTLQCIVVLCNVVQCNGVQYS